MEIAWRYQKMPQVEVCLCARRGVCQSVKRGVSVCQERCVSQCEEGCVCVPGEGCVGLSLCVMWKWDWCLLYTEHVWCLLMVLWSVLVDCVWKLFHKCVLIVGVPFAPRCCRLTLVDRLMCNSCPTHLHQYHTLE